MLRKAAINISQKQRNHRSLNHCHSRQTVVSSSLSTTTLTPVPSPAQVLTNLNNSSTSGGGNHMNTRLLSHNQKINLNYTHFLHCNYNTTTYCSSSVNVTRVQQQRLFSTNNKNSKINDKQKDDGETNNKQNNVRSSTESSTTINVNNQSINDFINSISVDKRRIVIGLGVVTISAISLPIVRRQFEDKQEESQEYPEVGVDEEQYDQMKEVSAEIDGEISKRILGEDFQQQLTEGGKQKAVHNTVTLVSDVLQSDALQNAVTNLIARIVGSVQFQGACQMLLKNLWDDLINDPETTAQIVALLNTAIKDERIKKSFKELIIGLLQDEEVNKELTALVVKLGEEKAVLEATRELLTESAHRALNDPEILDHSMEFATDIIGDNVLQKQSGEALRNTVSFAVKPSLSTFLSIFGLALLFFSASALGNARISARQGKEIDAAASVVAKSISNHVISAMSKILSMPMKAVSGLTSAIIATLLYPFQLIGRTADAVVVAGQTAFTTVIDLFAKATSFPAFVRDLVSLSFRSTLGYLSIMADKSYLGITSIPGIITSQSKILLSALRESILKGSISLWSLISSNTWLLLTGTGTKLSNVSSSIISCSRSRLDKLGAQMYILLASIISSSRASLDKLGNDMLVVLSNILSNILANFKGAGSSSTQDSST